MFAPVLWLAGRLVGAHLDLYEAETRRFLAARH
jgi:hypothetical protein